MRYPVYIISKGRHDKCITARALDEMGIDYKVVIEPQEKDAYAQKILQNTAIPVNLPQREPAKLYF